MDLFFFFSCTLGYDEAHIGNCSLLQATDTRSLNNLFDSTMPGWPELYPCPCHSSSMISLNGLYTGYSCYIVLGSVHSSYVSTGKAGGLSANSDA